MEDKRYDPYTGYEIKEEDSTQKYNAQNDNHTDNTAMKMIIQNSHNKNRQAGSAIATMILGIIAVVCMVSCCCTPLAIILGIAAIICFIVTPKVNETRGTKAKAGLICGIIAIIGSIILITVFVINVFLSADFQNEMKEFDTNYDKYTEQMDDTI